KSRKDAFEDWKPSRERVDLAFASARADQFLQVVELEERTRSAIAAETQRLSDLVAASNAVRFVGVLAREWIEKHKAPAKDRDELDPKEPGRKYPDDPWKHPVVYRAKDQGFVVLSLGPDGKEGTADDVGEDLSDVLRTLPPLKRIADALVEWRATAE